MKGKIKDVLDEYGRVADTVNIQTSISSSDMKFFTTNTRGSWATTVSVTFSPGIGEATPVSITWPILGASQTKFTPRGFVNHFTSSPGGIPVTTKANIFCVNIDVTARDRIRAKVAAPIFT